jgi:hypothetical protein
MYRLLAVALVACLSSSAFGIGSITNYDPSDPAHDFVTEGWVMHSEPNFTYVRPDVPSVRTGVHEDWVQYSTNFWASPEVMAFQFSNAPAASVPEPSSFALAGLSAIAAFRRLRLNRSLG